MRKFYLEDEIGNRQSLNGAGSAVFLSAPTGLGVSMESSFVALQSGFFLDTGNNAEAQANIVCDFVFIKNAYADYRAFINWITAAQELYFVYCPYGDEEFYRRVKLQYVTKTELTAGKWLTAPVSFLALTPWYKAAPGTLELSREADSVIRYAFAYTTDLSYCSGRAGSMTAEITPEGHLPAAYDLTIRGPLRNPMLTLLDGTTEKPLGKCVISDTISASETLSISTRYGDCYVRKTNAEGVTTDLLDKLDLAFDPFPHIPQQRNCYVTLSAEETIEETAQIKVYYYYRSV